MREKEWVEKMKTKQFFGWKKCVNQQSRSHAKKQTAGGNTAGRW